MINVFFFLEKRELGFTGLVFLCLSAGAFQAFDQDGDGTIRLSVLEVRTCRKTSRNLRPANTNMYIFSK